MSDQKVEVDEKAKEETRVKNERAKNANPGFFLRSATWLLSRFPLTKNRYQNWTSGRRILVGWLLWFVCLPIIPIALALFWYIKDPEGFKKSPYAKALIALVIAWSVGFGFIATSPEQIDQNGRYSPVQTEADGETSGSITEKPESVATEEAKENVASKQESNPTNGQEYANCTEAFEDGVFNIKRSDPSYQSKLDRDNDGYACEK